MLKRAHVLLNTSGASGFSPPVEFRLFQSGVNDTAYGPFIFDEQAAQSVMAAYSAHAKRVMVDLEHLSLDQESRSFDPDPRAWVDLEVRNGELWATRAEWLADGQRRLQEKLQPYVSPTFDVDDEGRIIKILNIAMTALPATHQPYALVAASERRKLSGDKKRMDPELVKKAMAVLESADGEAAIGLLKDLVAAAASGEAPPAEDPPADAPPDPAVAEMSELTGAETPAQALSVIKGWKKIADDAKAAADAALLSERKQLAGKLVALGAETPATAYVEENGAKRLADRLVGESIESLRARVTALSAVKRGPVTPPALANPQNPEASSAPTVKLSDRELADCKARGLDPVQVLARKAALLEKTK